MRKTCRTGLFERLGMGGMLAACTLSMGAVAHAEEQGFTWSDETKKECVAAYERAQVLRESGHFLESLDALTTCSRETCHPALRHDCIQWHGELITALPTVVVSARTAARDLFDVRVFVDGALTARRLDGRPLQLNPGTHKFRFESPGHPPEERELLLVPGEKNRAILITFQETQSPPGASAPPPSNPTEAQTPRPAESVSRAPANAVTEQERPVPTLSYVFGALAVVGVGGFVGLGVTGFQDYKSLESSCKPTCTSSQVDPVRTKFILADVSLGIGIASAVAATIIFLNRPTHEHARSHERAHLEPSLEVDPVRESAALTLRGQF